MWRCKSKAWFELVFQTLFFAFFTELLAPLLLYTTKYNTMNDCPKVCVLIARALEERSCRQCDAASRRLWQYSIFECGHLELLLLDVVGRHDCWTLCYSYAIQLRMQLLAERNLTTIFICVSLNVTIHMCNSNYITGSRQRYTLMHPLISIKDYTTRKKKQKFLQHPRTPCPTNAAPVAKMERAQVTWSNTGGILSGSAHLVQK